MSVKAVDHIVKNEPKPRCGPVRPVFRATPNQHTETDAEHNAPHEEVGRDTLDEELAHVPDVLSHL